MSEKTQSPILACENLSKGFPEAGQLNWVLNEVSLSLAAGERLAVVGSSGSGKSTLLHLLGGLDTPSKGSVTLQGQALAALNPAERTLIRRQQLGFVYQFHHLLPECTALENVALPLLLGDEKISTVKALAAEQLAQVGLQARLSHKPSQLSGGERQRVAIARAMIHRPQVILADEPTGNLDDANAQQVQQLLLSLNQNSGTSMVIVTHDQQFAQQADRVVRLEKGRLVS